MPSPNSVSNHAGKALRADLLQVGLPAPLPVELREVTNRGVLAQRQAVLPRHLEEMREQPRMAVQVVVRVQVRGRTAHQGLKARELGV